MTDTPEFPALTRPRCLQHTLTVVLGAQAPDLVNVGQYVFYHSVDR